MSRQPPGGDVTLEPLDEADSETLFESTRTLALDNLNALTIELDAERPLAPEVLDALDSARRALGEDGQIEVNFHDARSSKPSSITKESIQKLSSRVTERSTEYTRISGRLHLIDLEPDKLAVRTVAGVEWMCRYPQHLEELVRGLIGEVVWAAGQGRLQSPLRGSMEVEELGPASQGEQSTLFSSHPLPLSELLAHQSIVRPQGLASLGDPEWEDDEASEVYLRTVFGDE